MKALLSMAKQKRQNDTPNQSSSITKKSQMNKFPQAPSQMSQQSEEFDQNYQPQIQQILAYAQFIGMKLPEEQDLLWIAKEGLQTQLPPDWEQAETQDGEVAYTNTRTGQVMFQHPCDEYYRELVQKQRKKQGSKIIKKSLPSQPTGGSIQPIGMIGSMSKAKPLQMRQPQPILDPLVKMQRQKQQKRLQQQKRKQFQQKKTSMKQKFQSKKQQIQKQYKQKQDKTKQRFNEQLQNQRKENTQKMSQKQKQLQRKREQQIRQFQKQTKIKEERLLQQKTRKQKQKIQKKYQQKKEQMRQKLQRKLKDSKKQIDQVYKQKYLQLQSKQKAMAEQSSQLSQNVTLEDQISGMKSQIIRNKLSKFSQKLKQQNQRQKSIYTQQTKKLQSVHNERIRQLQQKSTSQQGSMQSGHKLQQLIRQIQAYQKQQMKIFQYQIQVMKEMKRFELEERVQEYRVRVNQMSKDRLRLVTQEMGRDFDEFKQLKQEQCQKVFVQTQKRAKQEFLYGLRHLEKKFIQQEQITFLQNRKSLINPQNKAVISQKHSLEQLSRLYQQLQSQQQQMRKQRENIKLQIENLRSQSNVANPLTKMNQQQVSLYQLIQDKIRSGYKAK